ncbi:MAG: hypothetical protein VXW32_02725 [Myxococcota bacterium]|nr:hypothetical protein [Myxococcota bacterium]
MKRITNNLLWAASAVLFCFGSPTVLAQDTGLDPSHFDEPSEEEVEDQHLEESLPDWDEDEDEDEDFESEDPGEDLEDYRADGRRIYLICIFGAQDHGIVTRKCRQMEQELERAYGTQWVTRLNNPSETQLQRIHDRVGHDIAAVVVVTHSTPDSEQDSGYDVWDCPLEPDDFADIFDEEWVIWNGCFSRGICELADNILPTQCEDGVLSSTDDTWREILRCLERTGGAPHDRNEICEMIWQDDWDEDWKPAK